MTNPETEPVCKFEQGCHRVVPCDPGCGTPVVPPPMSRAAKAEALLLRFTAEAHRRKWTYDRGLDGDGVPVKSEAFDALHRLGEEMRVALEELRRAPAAVSVPPPAPRADALRWAAEAVGALDRRELGIQADTIRDAWEEGRDEAADLLRRLADEEQREPDDTDLTEADVDRMMAEGAPVQIVTAPPGTYAAAAIASCPGYEMNPNPCRCPCEGCKHHCAAHNPDAGEAQQPDDGEGDELVCVDECGFCDACGFEPFGTPAEGWREAARFLRRTARDSGDRQGVLHGARLIEAELHRLADESGPCVAGEQQNETPTAKACPHNHTWPDRSVCLPPCGAMHDRCVDCETAVDDCPNDAAGARQDGAQHHG